MYIIYYIHIYIYIIIIIIIMYIYCRGWKFIRKRKSRWPKCCADVFFLLLPQGKHTKDVEPPQFP